VVVTNLAQERRESARAFGSLGFPIWSLRTPEG
jgi:hypothetical protein